jgi:transposase
MSGALYVFINRRATQMRVLYFDRSGFCIWAKRLEAGRFVGDWSQVRTREMDDTGLKLLFEGIEVRRQRKRYQLPKLEKTFSNTSSNTITAIQFNNASSAAAAAAERD